MLRESRPMPGRNFGTVLLLAVALVGCGGDDAPAGIRVRDYTVHSKAVDRSGDESSYLHDPFFKALKALGPRAPIVAFPDDAHDFARHDVVASARRLTRLPVWLDAGDADPVLPGDDAFAANLRAAGAHARVHAWPGGHNGDYWGDYLRFYARALRRC